MVKTIKKQKWNTTLKRYTQHYGYTYNYTSKSITNNDYLGEFPDFIKNIVKKITDTKKIDKDLDQVIINRYLPGEGINPHIDRPQIFGDQICSLSLNSGCVMEFTKGAKKVSVYLHRRSLLIMEGDARYGWKHSIKGVTKDIKNDVEKKRGTRYSLTCRTMILD